MLKNKRGYTLLEALIAFSITMLIVSLVPLAFKTIMWSPFSGYESSLELNVFLNQLSVDVRESGDMVVDKNKVTLMINNEEVRYELISGSIRRFVQGKGYVPMLHSVQSFSCSVEESRLSCDAVLQNGLSAQRSMSSMFSKVADLS